MKAKSIKVIFDTNVWISFLFGKRLSFIKNYISSGKITVDGSITNVQCENSPGYGVCEEGVRIIKKFKKWIPAQINNINVNSYKRQPISLAIQGF